MSVTAVLYYTIWASKLMTEPKQLEKKHKTLPPPICKYSSSEHKYSRKGCWGIWDIVYSKQFCAASEGWILHVHASFCASMGKEKCSFERDEIYLCLHPLAEVIHCSL